MPRIHILLLPIVLSLLQPAFAARITLPTPAGSGAFGATVTALPNRNIVVTDEGFDDPVTGVANVGAAHLFSPTGALISTLRGSTVNDAVARKIIVLANGNYLVSSPVWGSLNQGAVTFCRADVGCEGVVSAANSLVGSQNGDIVGSESRIFPLTNGNYIVVSSAWDNGTIFNAGAVTWGSGISGISGPVSIANSLVGSTANDAIGNGEVLTLSNGNYVIAAIGWDSVSPALTNTGAITFGNGATGIVGPVSTLNSFTSGIANVELAQMRVVGLRNGNYVVSQPNWNNGAALRAGAITFASGSTGLLGIATLGNSLVGSSTDDLVGLIVTPLANGNYVVLSEWWAGQRGAVTFGSGTLGVTGVVSASNSLVGSTAVDRVGLNVLELSNGSYVTFTGFWDAAGTSNVGAVTWGSGVSGVTGAVSASNSLVGSVINDQMGVLDRDVTALSNGNYVIACQSCDLDGVVNNSAAIFARGDGSSVGVLTPAMAFMAGFSSNDRLNVAALSNGNYVIGNRFWSNGAITGVGAATFANGAAGITGAATAVNSLIGSTAGDRVGELVTALSNGNYVVRSAGWNNGVQARAGAATFASGVSGLSGVVSAANSLVGSTRDDAVGSLVTALSNGNYVVSSPNWNNGAIVDTGASTWGSGVSGITGVITPANSFVGTRTGDQIGNMPFVALRDGNYVLRSQFFATATVGNVDVSTFGLGEGLATQPGVLSLADLAGPLTDNNSVIGMLFNAAGDPSSSTFAYNPSATPQDRTLIVAMPRENRVVLLNYDGLFQDGFE